MENAIIIGILLVMIAVAALRVKKHFKGGGCCGSASTTIRSPKKLADPKLGEKLLTVEGMRCENCQARVENALNRLDGVACRVNLRKKRAAVSYSAEVSDEALRAAVEELGYRVTEIR